MSPVILTAQKRQTTFWKSQNYEYFVVFVVTIIQWKKVDYWMSQINSKIKDNFLKKPDHIFEIPGVREFFGVCFQNQTVEKGWLLNISNKSENQRRLLNRFFIAMFRGTPCTCASWSNRPNSLLSVETRWCADNVSDSGVKFTISAYRILTLLCR